MSPLPPRGASPFSGPGGTANSAPALCDPLLEVFFGQQSEQAGTAGSWQQGGLMFPLSYIFLDVKLIYNGALWAFLLHLSHTWRVSVVNAKYNKNVF